MAVRPPGLGRLPRLPLAHLPTPLVPLPRMSKEAGTEVWIKRDDLTGVGLGGNKARKLEFLAADARACHADVLVTGGGPGSNHVQLTAAAAARLGMVCHAVLYGSPPQPEPANLGLARLFGATISFTRSEDRSSVDPELESVAEALRAQGRRPYVIPRGGASPVGCCGYVEGAFELQAQLDAAGVSPSHLFVATGSSGTQAGLVLGAALAEASYQIVGVTVSRPQAECLTRIAALAGGCADLIGVAVPDDERDVTVLDGYLGPGYGQPSTEGVAAARLAAATEGLVLDPTFTAKAMAALLVETQAGHLPGPVVFVHTGGLGGVFGGAP